MKLLPAPERKVLQPDSAVLPKKKNKEISDLVEHLKVLNACNAARDATQDAPKESTQSEKRRSMHEGFWEFNEYGYRPPWKDEYKRSPQNINPDPFMRANGFTRNPAMCIHNKTRFTAGVWICSECGVRV